MRDRTDAEREANYFDCEIYHLIVRAERHRWPDVVMALKRIRVDVRKRMCPEDRRGTEG